MEQKKYRIESTAVTRDISDFVKVTNNIYETLAILSKRANQISSLLKEELNQKIQEFSTPGDTLEEVFENREQIEVAKHYEQLPKPTLISINEYLNNKLYFRNPIKENSENNF